LQPSITPNDASSSSNSQYMEVYHARR
jgi:hypothetical protein